jgi:hypothetical protein
MLSTRIRTTIVTLVAAASITGTAIVPAVSQAQYNNFGFLNSAEGYKLKTQGSSMPCQPETQVEVTGLGIGGAPSSSPVTKYSKDEVNGLLMPMQYMDCEAS